MNLREAISAIGPVDKDAAKACLERFDFVAKPVGSLGMLEDLLIRIASVTGSADIDISKKAVAVFCSDNGVVRRGVAQGGQEITTAVAGILGSGRASVTVMAEACGADVFCVDMGMADSVRGLRDCKLMPGTDDFCEGPAMSRETAEKAVMTGVGMVRELKESGYKLIATGEAGIGNTTTSSAVVSVLLNRPAQEVTGRGAGLDDAGLARKLEAIKLGIEKNKPDRYDPMDVLSKVGGLDIAAMTGVFLGGALYRVPIVMDGFISGAAALLAVRLCPDVLSYILPSHGSGEPGAKHLLSELGLTPVIQAGMRLGEGTGAVALFPLLDLANAVYSKAATFADINVDQYKRL